MAARPTTMTLNQRLIVVAAAMVLLVVAAEVLLVVAVEVLNLFRGF